MACSTSGRCHCGAITGMGTWNGVKTHYSALAKSMARFMGHFPQFPAGMDGAQVFEFNRVLAMSRLLVRELHRKRVERISTRYETFEVWPADNPVRRLVIHRASFVWYAHVREERR